MNRVVLIGRLTRDINLRQTQSGSSVAGFILAVDRGLSKEKRAEAERYDRPTADFVSCQAWNMTANLLAQYCRKGSKVAIEGRLQTGSYADKETDKTVYTTDVVVDRVEFLERANRDNAGNGPTGQSDRDDEFFEDDFEEVQDDGRIPF